MNRNDFLLMAALAAAAVLLWILLFAFRGNETGSQVVITLRGNLYGTYSLQENAVIEIKEETGTNVIVIEEGSVFIREADCPDGYCVAKGGISRTGETIVCLPHRLVVEIQSGSSQEEDDRNIQDYDVIAE